MKIKLGFVSGFALGYYLGAMAGRQRYEQLNRLGKRLKRSSVLDAATDKAKAAADVGYSRAKDKVEHKLHHNGNGATEFTPS